MSGNEFIPYRCPVCLEVKFLNGPAPAHRHGRAIPLLPCAPRLEPAPLVLLEEEVRRLVPWLRKRDWYPMTYMMIPSVLSAAALLRLRLRASAAEDPERATALEACVADLVRGFRGRTHKATTPGEGRTTP